MIAIFKDGGRQYRAAEGNVLFVDRRKEAPGDTIEFSEVLLVEDGGDVQVGQPTLEGGKVVARVLDEVKAPKVIFHQYRRRKNSRSRSGHRQRYTRIQIEKISI